jgi:hypothetical protein
MQFDSIWGLCKAIKRGTLLYFFMFVVTSAGYAEDLYVGFPGVHGSKDLVCDKWVDKETVPPSQDTGIYRGPYVCVRYHLVLSDIGKIYVEKLLSATAPTPVTFSNNLQAKSAWAPSMEKFNGQYYMAFKDGYNRIYYSWSQDGRYWANPYTVNGLMTIGTPQLQAFNGRLYLFFLRSDKAVVYTSTADGSSWASLKSTGAGSSKPPKLTVFKGKMYMTYRGKSSQYLYVQSTSNGTSWSSAVQIRQKTSEAPSIAVHNGQLFIAYKGGTTERIYLIRSSNGVSWTSSWIPSSTWKTDKGPAIESFNNKLYLAFKGTNSDKVYYSSSKNGINSWSAFVEKSYSKSKGMLNLNVY